MAFGVLEVDESLAEEKAIVRGRLFRTAVTGVAMAAIAAALALLFGLRLVGRPIGRLIGMARAIDSGDFSRRIDVRGADEISHLGRTKSIAGEPDSPELTVRSAEIIATQVERMSRIIRQLLDFARGPALAKAPTDLREILADCVAMLVPMAEKHQNAPKNRSANHAIAPAKLSLPAVPFPQGTPMLLP